MKKSDQRRALELFSILCMAWLFYALDGSVVSVLITNSDFNKVSYGSRQRTDAQTFAIDADRLGLFGLFPAVGALISVCGVGGLVNRWYGRKRTFHIATSLVIIGVILQTFPNNWPALLIGRIVMGIGGDMNGLCLGYYVTEIAPKNVRGRALILVQQFASSFIGIAGSWIAYGIAYLPQDKSYSWKVANSLQFVPGVVFFVMIFWLPESPRWLARKYPTNDQPILEALASVRNRTITDPEIIEEAKEIRDYDTWHRVHGNISPWNVLTQWKYFKRVLYAFVPYMAQQFSGVGTIGIYAAIIYESLGLYTQHNALLLNSCLQILYAIAALGSSYVVEKLGRRPCIVWGSLINTIGLACICGLAIGTQNSPNIVANGWVVAFITLMTCNYWLLTTGPSTVYANEIMQTQAREIGVGMAQVFPIGFAVAIGQKWPIATQNLGAKSYVILLVLSGFSFVCNWFFIVEPKGLSIERIDALFGEGDHVEETRQELQEKVIEPTSELQENEKEDMIREERVELV